MKKIGVAVFAVCMAAGVKATDTLPKDTTKVVDVEEIVVIASPKENTKMRQLPASVSLLSRQMLEAAHVEALRDASAMVPNFFMPDYGSRLTSAVYIRGIGARINTPAVGLYVDNVPYIDKSAFDFNFYDVERIDILRGPQGTLYGRNTMGGLIKVSTRSPFSYQGTDLKLGYEAESNHYTGALTHYHRVNSQFAFSAGGFYEHSSGFFTNTVTGKKADPLQSGGGRIRTLWLPKDNLKFDFTVSYEYTDQGGYAYGLYDRQTGKIAPIAYNDESNYRRSLFNSGLNIEYQAEGFVLSAVTGYQHLDDRMFLDQDFTAADIYTIEQKQRLNTLSEEIVFKSKPGRRWQWATGVFGFYQWLHTDGPVDFKEEGVRTMIEQNVNRTFEALHDRNPKVPEMSLNVKNDLLRVGGSFDTPVLSGAVYHQSTVNDLFVQGLSLTAGLRLDYEKNRLTYASVSDLDFDFRMKMGQMPLTMEGLKADPDLKGKESNDYLQLLPKFALQYTFGSGNVYATVAKGYRSGGYNIQMFSDILSYELQRSMMARTKQAAKEKILSMMPDLPEAAVEGMLSSLQVPAGQDVRASTIYKPETTWSYEVGTHLNLLGGKLQADASVFCMLTSDQQIAMFAPTGLGRMTVNAGESRSTGCEVAVQAAPVRGLSLSAAYGFTQAKFTDYCRTEKQDGQLIEVSYEGKYVPMVPRHTLNAGASYTLAFSGQNLRRITFGLSYSAAGQIYWTEQNDVQQPFAGSLNGRISFGLGELQLDIWSRNLLDTHYTAFYFESMGRGFAQQNKPRQCGVDLRFRF